jgi:hypothetical protein
MDAGSCTLLPWLCTFCGSPPPRFSSVPICDTCWTEIPLRASPACVGCGDPLDEPTVSGERAQALRVVGRGNRATGLRGARGSPGCCRASAPVKIYSPRIQSVEAACGRNDRFATQNPSALAAHGRSYDPHALTRHRQPGWCHAAPAPSECAWSVSCFRSGCRHRERSSADRRHSRHRRNRPRLRHGLRSAGAESPSAATLGRAHRMYALAIPFSVREDAGAESNLKPGNVPGLKDENATMNAQNQPSF